MIAEVDEDEGSPLRNGANLPHSGQGKSNDQRKPSGYAIPRHSFPPGFDSANNSPQVIAGAKSRGWHQFMGQATGVGWFDAPVSCCPHHFKLEDPPTCVESSDMSDRVMRLRSLSMVLRDWNIAAMTLPESPSLMTIRSRSAEMRASYRNWWTWSASLRSMERQALDIRAGQRMARPQPGMPIRTSAIRARWSWFTTASWKTFLS